MGNPVTDLHEHIYAEHGWNVDPEMLARAIGECPKTLLWRFRDTVECLVPELRAKMRGARFDFEAKTYTGKGFRLSYRVRRHPDKPVEYRNQQTSWGFVALEWVD